MSKDPSYTPSEALDVVYGIFFDEEEDKELMELVRSPPQSTSDFFMRQEHQNHDNDRNDCVQDQEEEIDLNIATDDEKN